MARGQIALALLLVTGFVLRFWARSPLWLDEAQSVAIAKQPLSHLSGLLREDGSPPLYYVLLHLWMSVLGRGHVAVRALSGIVSVAGLWPMWLVGCRLGGRRAGNTVLVIGLTSPFAVRYATETRMYALVMLLVPVVILAMWEAERRPGPRGVVMLGGAVGALLLTHYWALYFAVALLGAVVLNVQGSSRAARRRVALGVALGGAIFAPWLPVLVWQTAHTGTPWAARPGIPQMLNALGALGLGFGTLRGAVTVLSVAGAATTVWRASGAAPIRRRPLALLWWLAVVPVVLAFAVGALTRSALATRYMAVAVVPMLILSGVGLARMRGGAWRQAALAATVLAGLGTALTNIGAQRTQAQQAAAVLGTGVRPGDLVVYCPNQLGPDVSRLLPSTVAQTTFPRFTPPALVDWTDYRATIQSTNIPAFAQQVVDRVGATGTVWMVWAPGYRGLDRPCDALADAVEVALPEHNTVLVPQHRFHEADGVLSFRQGTAPPPRSAAPLSVMPWRPHLARSPRGDELLPAGSGQVDDEDHEDGTGDGPGVDARQGDREGPNGKGGPL